MARRKEDLEKEIKDMQETIERFRKNQKTKNANYNKNSVDRINFTVPKGRKQDVTAYAEKSGSSVNAFISGTILDIVDGKKILVDASGKSSET